MRLLDAAEIIAVGSELLTPHRVDTNSLYLTARLNGIGIAVRAKLVVGDDRENLAAHLRQAMARADVVVTTGGLGPTDDDLTREVVARVLDLPLVEDPSVLAGIEERFRRRRIRMPDINRRQALVPRGAAVLANPHGTAPGLWIASAGPVVILLPGPPREMQALFEEQVEPRLVAAGATGRLWRRVIKTTGRAESQIDEVAQPLYSQWMTGDVPIETTVLAAPGQIEVHLSARGQDEPHVTRALDAAVRLLAAALGPVVFSEDGRSLEAVVGGLLRERGLRIAAAESCTGGLLLGRLTDVPGSSDWVVGGVVAYANQVKIRDLDVPPSLIAEHGAVSEPVARVMAEAICSRLGADVGIGITGIAGPGGGSVEKPVGTVVIAVAGVTSLVRTFAFLGDRQFVRLQAVTAALDMVRRALK
jgi:nicotinamide-nucleotide amidase